MATTTICRMAAIAALVLALACYGVSAHSPAPETATAPSPAGSGCFNVLVNMSDCLTYVEDGSNLTKPDKGCCPELAGLVDSNPICLCELLGNPESIGIKIDLNKALKLPSVCGVTTPPVSTCSAVGVPVSLSPSSEDSTSPISSPSEGPATSPSNGDAAPAPASGPNPSDAAAASPSGNKDNGALGIQASTLPFIFSLATVCLHILLILHTFVSVI